MLHAREPQELTAGFGNVEILVDLDKNISVGVGWRVKSLNVVDSRENGGRGGSGCFPQFI